MRFETADEAWAAVKRHHEGRPSSARDCRLDCFWVARPDGDRLATPCLYILGFNGGETKGQDQAPLRPTRSTAVWFNICDRAARWAGVDSYLIVERCHWGSPNVLALRQRIGSKAALLTMLKLHAEANRALFREKPPLVVWVPGLATYIEPAIEHYRLEECLPPKLRPARKGKPEGRNALWREFVDSEGVPFLVTLHPTGARPNHNEMALIFGKLGQLAQRQRAAVRG